MKLTKIVLEQREKVAWVILNRPDVMNCLDDETLLQLTHVLQEVEKDAAVRVVVITGKGKAFSAGADLKFVQTLASAKNLYDWLSLFANTCSTLANLSKPTIAAVNGITLAGGFELMLACDLAVAAEDAKIGDQHANYALMPAGGATSRLTWLLGPRKAKEIMLTGKWISGKEAEAIGLVNKAVPATELEKATIEMANTLVSKNPLGLKVMKQLINKAMETNLSMGIALELEVATRYLGTSKDVVEGVKAFTDRITPVFEGNWAKREELK
jgi:enoyl-CoA hydratase/carnithine racemase